VSAALVSLCLGVQVVRADDLRLALIVSAANLAFLVTSLVTGIAYLAKNLEVARAAQRKAEAELQQAQKLDAIGTLAGGMAHDLNNALQPIIMCATLLKEDAPAESPAQTDLDTIIESARRARDLVRRVLSFSRPSRPQRAPLHIAAAVEDAAKLRCL
jgi:signal transduction histidine kinase